MVLRPAWVVVEATMPALKKLTVRGFKSIKDLSDFELRPLNVLLGGNGAGKSNFIGLFRMLNEMVEQRLQLLVAKGGGADAFLHYGRKVTPKLEVELFFGKNGYLFTLEPTADNRLAFSRETFWFDGSSGKITTPIGTGRFESQARHAAGGIAKDVQPALESWRVFHFHDTSDSAAVKRLHGINDNEALRPDAANLAAFLLRLKLTSSSAYSTIRDSVRQVMPAFDDFMLRQSPLDPSSIQLEWREKGSDYPFLAHQLSDGTLRFICLATLLLQPTPPTTIVIDEPELGLHPFALNVLASLLKSAATRTQIIIATQSMPLVESFSPEDVIVVDRHDGASQFERLDPEKLKPWLDEYSLGELWEKNVIGGRPSR